MVNLADSLMFWMACLLLLQVLLSPSAAFSMGHRVCTSHRSLLTCAWHGRSVVSCLAHAEGPTLLDSNGPVLLDSYDTTTEKLLEEIAATELGDEIFFQLYLLEAGVSSERVLSALSEAGSQRGVQVRFGLDVSYGASASTRSRHAASPRQLSHLIPPGPCCSLDAVPPYGKDYNPDPDRGGDGNSLPTVVLLHLWLEAGPLKGALNHHLPTPRPSASSLGPPQFALFLRSDGRSTAILGGMNIGDRFRGWNDFTVRLTSPWAEQLDGLLRSGRGRDVSIASGNRYAQASATAVTTPVAAGAMAAAIGTTATAAPLAAVYTTWTGECDFLSAVVATVAVAASAAFVLGCLSGAAADGSPFSFWGEVRSVCRALLYDRSWVGDVSSPLRPVFAPPPVASGRTAAASPLVEQRYLPALPPSAEAVQFVCNRRETGVYEMEPAFRALFSDASLVRYRVTMAYLGPRWGVELIEMALRRGASVDLLLPARANVYAHANLKAAQKLIDAGWLGLRLYLEPSMVHAKATVAWDASGSRSVAFLGSANLVRGSLNLPVWCQLLPFDELNVLVRDGAFAATLNESMGVLFDRADRVAPRQRLLEDSDWYSERSAWLDELWQ